MWFFSAHLLDECEQKAKYVECEKCNEAVEAENLKEHQLNKKICFPKRPGKVRSKPNIKGIIKWYNNNMV